MKTLIQAAVFTLFAASTVQAQQAVQWKVSDGGNGHWYQVVVVASGSSWTSANSEAAARNGYLASLRSSTEATFVRLLVNATAGAFTSNPGGNEVGPWLGATRIIGTNGWRWTSGEAWGFTQWCSGEPSGGSSEPYVHLMRNGATSCWNDRENNAFGVGNPGFVIEWSADCNNDGIVDYGQCCDGSLPDYNGNNIPDCCEAGTPCVVGNYPVQWRVQDGGNGHWYLFDERVLHWQPHLERAMSQGASLACITTQQEWSFAKSLLRIQGNDVWIGAISEGSTAQPPLRWVSGEPFDFSVFCQGGGNPDGGYAVEICGRGDCPVQFCWNIESEDCLCWPGNKALYEWSADCNSDGIVDKGQILQGQLADTNADGVPDICQGPTCADADIYRDFNVNGADLGILLSQWGPNTPLTESDLNRDGVVNGADLGLLLSFWGSCP